VIVVIVRATDPARIAEGLRAGLGLTLRGDRVRVFVDARAPLAAAAARAAATLRSFGHEVIEDAPPDAVAAALRTAHAIEVWT
jgi:hypothetical protein